MISLIGATCVLAMAGLYLLVLGTFGLIRPKQLTVFLANFASTPGAHYLELFLRSLVGMSLLIVASLGPFSTVCKIIGWILLGTSTALLFVPWRQHRRFAQMVSPLVERLAPLIGWSSIAAAIALGLKLIFVVKAW
jgi:hypothetical protein